MQNVSSSNSEKALVPKLRFPEFTGEYSSVQLGKIANKVVRNDPNSNAPIMMISAASGFINQSIKYSRENAGKSLKKYTLLKQGELAYNHGASKLRTFGCCFELEEKEARIPYVYHTFSINEKQYTHYIAKYLNNPLIDKQLKKLVTSSVRMDGLLNISYNEYMGIRLNIPNYSEQEKVSKFLTLIDKKIQLQQQLIENLKLYKRGVLHRIFNKEFKSKTFTEWKEKSLKSVFHLARDYVLPVSEISVVKTSEYQYPVYSSQTKNDGLLGYYNQYLFEDAITWTTDGANAGYTRFRKGKFYCTNVCGVLISNDNQANEYIAERINYVTKKHVSYVGNPKLMNNVMAEIKIDFPEISEQQYYSKFIEKLNIKLYNFESQFDVLEKLKTGILQQMFI